MPAYGVRELGSVDRVVPADFGKLLVWSKTATNATLTLPAPGPGFEYGFWVWIDNPDSTKKTITPEGCTVDGSTSDVTVRSKNSVTFYSDGEKWHSTQCVSGDVSFVRITGVISGGYFPGTRQFWDEPTSSWLNGPTVKVKSSNGETLTPYARYACHFESLKTDGTQVYVSQQTGILAMDTEGDPFTISAIAVDEATGQLLTVTDGTAYLANRAANGEYWGVMSNGTQVLHGWKKFEDPKFTVKGPSGTGGVTANINYVTIQDAQAGSTAQMVFNGSAYSSIVFSNEDTGKSMLIGYVGDAPTGSAGTPYGFRYAGTGGVKFVFGESTWTAVSGYATLMKAGTSDDGAGNSSGYWSISLHNKTVSGTNIGISGLSFVNDTFSIQVIYAQMKLGKDTTLPGSPRVIRGSLGYSGVDSLLIREESITLTAASTSLFGTLQIDYDGITITNNGGPATADNSRIRIRGIDGVTGTGVVVSAVGGVCSNVVSLTSLITAIAGPAV